MGSCISQRAKLRIGYATFPLLPYAVQCCWSVATSPLSRPGCFQADAVGAVISNHCNTRTKMPARRLGLKDSLFAGSGIHLERAAHRAGWTNSAWRDWWGTRCHRRRKTEPISPVLVGTSEPSQNGPERAPVGGDAVRTLNQFLYCALIFVSILLRTPA